MKIYLAAPWVDREQMPAIADELEARGHKITHPWWTVEVDDMDVPAHKKCAQQDVAGVFHADAVLLINSKKSEGKSVEQGIAIALGRPIVAVGKLGEHSQNVFHYLDDYHWVDSLSEAYRVIDRLGDD